MKKIVEKLAHLLAGEVEKNGTSLPCWLANLKNWHALRRLHAKLKNRHTFGTFIGTLARKNEKLARFWQVGTLARMTHMTRDLANSLQAMSLIPAA